tara:strand:- start:679 stop:1104 length:426 start_codon:yes stop_codon:yes gene_type:complete
MPKPVLSDSLFNADDVATAILNNANLQIANEDLGVVDGSSEFVLESGWVAWHGARVFKFNGIVFFNIAHYKSSTPGSYEKVFTVSSGWRPEENYYFNTVSRDADTATMLQFKTDGDVYLENATNTGDSTYHLVSTGFYRLA